MSVLSASGSWLMRGASRWLEARAAGTAGERSSAPRPSAAHAPMTDRDGALPFDSMRPSFRPPTVTDAGTGTDLYQRAAGEAFPLATGPGPELTALYRATTLSAPWEPGRLRGRGRGGGATVRQYARGPTPAYASTAYTSTGAATPFKGTAPHGRRTRPLVSPSAARVDSVRRIEAPRSRVFTCRRAAWFTASPTMV